MKYVVIVETKKINHQDFISLSCATKGRVQKKNREYNEFGTNGGGVSDLNHYLK